MKDHQDVIFLSGNGNFKLGSKILEHLSELFGKRCFFGHINFNKYPEGELDNRIVNHENIKGKIVVIYQSIFKQQYEDELTDLVWALKHQYGARYIIGVFPFFWNRRQDPIMEENINEKWSKKIAKPEEIQRLKKSISILHFCGLNEMIVATPHSNAMALACKEYEIKFNEINPTIKFATTVHTFTPEEEWNLLRVYAPDAGSIPRAVKLASILHCPVLFNLKNRAINSVTSIVDEKKEEIDRLVEEFRQYYKFDDIYYITSDLIKGNIIVIIEDEVASGGTANTTANRLKELAAKAIMLLATHAVLIRGWKNKLFYMNPFSRLVLSNTIPRGHKKRTGGKIFDINLAQEFGDSLFRILDSM